MPEHPEFLVLLRDAIVENFPGKNGVKWLPSWDKALISFYEQEIAKGIPEAVFISVAEQLGSYDKQAKNYPLKFRTFYRNELRWRPPPIAHSTTITPITPEVEEAWGS